MRTHLGTNHGSLCITEARNPQTTVHLADVDCKRCIRDLAALHERESDAAAEQRRLARWRDAAYVVGMSEPWEQLADRTDPAGEMVRNILGPIAVWLLEERASPP